MNFTSMVFLREEGYGHYYFLSLAAPPKYSSR